MKENKRNIPLSILIENAKQEYLTQINLITEKYNIPPYFVWTIFSGFLAEMERNKDNQIISEMQLLEENKEQKDNKKEEKK